MKNIRPIPYSRQQIDEQDIQAVVEVLRSDYLTTGPRVEEFEKGVAEACQAGYGVALSSGTAALHAALVCAGIGSGDEVVVPSLTFAATANAAVYCGATPVFADVNSETLLVSPESVKSKLTDRTRAIVGVDYGGQPCDYDELGRLASDCGAFLLADACHSLGAFDRSRPVGSLADATAFSFHPVKPITTAEGGMVVTDDRGLSDRIRRFRNHGISRDYRRRREQATWHYEIPDLGYNYRISDLHSALGLSQLKKSATWLQRRNEIAELYRQCFRDYPEVRPLQRREGVVHAYHLFVIRVPFSDLGLRREEVYQDLHSQGIGVNVHYLPVHLHPFYRERFGCSEGLCPEAERAYEEILSLPIFASMTDSEAERVTATLLKVLKIV